MCQLVDHFDPLNKATFEQWYYLSGETLKPSAPTFRPPHRYFFAYSLVFIGGEAAVEFFEFQEVSARQWAREYGALGIARI
jgi:hypothetical protein